MNIIYSEWNRWKRMMETEHKHNINRTKRSKDSSETIWSLRGRTDVGCWPRTDGSRRSSQRGTMQHKSTEGGIGGLEDWRLVRIWRKQYTRIYKTLYNISQAHTHTYIYIIFIYTSIHQLISYVQYMSRKILQLHWHRQAIVFFYCVQDGGISEQKWWTRAVKSRNVNVRSFLLRLMPRKVSVVSKLQCIVCICHLVLCCAFPSLEVYWAHEGPLSLCPDPGAGILWDGFWMIPAVNVSVPR